MAWQEEGEDMRRFSWARMGRIAVSTATVQDPAGSGWHSPSEYEEGVLTEAIYKAWA